MNAPAVELDPPAHTWAELVEFDPERHSDARAQFGLPTDRPIVMAGHQGGFWHAGIAAKLFAARSLANRIGGAVVWLVIDTDDTKPTELRLPTRDDTGTLIDRVIRVDRDDPNHPRAREAVTSYERHSDIASPELRATLATIDALQADKPSIVRSSQLSETGAFRTLVDHFRADASVARDEYNEAIAAHPNSGMAELHGDQVPFWRVTPSGARLPALECDLDGTLWPRALATTGVVRESLCDLFIHGTGGRAYEPINDHWLGTSLGWRLAPFVTATATVRLRFEGETVTEADAQTAAWRAHHARHHPRLLGDDTAQAARSELVDRIAQLPRGDSGRHDLFARLHELLDDTRNRHADRLAELESTASDLTRRASERKLREDRTWPVVLHDPANLAMLRDTIDASFDH